MTGKGSEREADELRKIIETLPKQDWWGRKETIALLKTRPEKDYIAFLEEGIRNNDDADVRNSAMEVYRELGGRAVPSLASLLNDGDPEVRLFAVNILTAIKDEKVLPLLLFAIKDTDVNVRAASAEALGVLGDGRALTALNEALSDEPWVAMAAVNAMGDIGGEEALDMLCDCLKTEGYQELAIMALEKAGDRACIPYLAQCFDESSLREPALNAIIKIAEREQIKPQPEYFMSLVPALIEMLGSPSREIKKSALLALCWSQDIKGLLYLIEAVKDEELQENAIEGLLNIGRRAVCSIVDELKGSTGSHRVMLAKVLAMIGEKKALLQFAEDEDPEVRTEAALALGSLDLRRAEEALSTMLSDPYEEVRLAARKSLGGMKRNG